MNRLRLVGAEAIRSLGANMSTTFAATVTVLIGMFLLGLLVGLGTWILSWSDHVREQLTVKVAFTETATPKQINAVRVYLGESKLAGGDVKSYTFISSAEALKIMRKRNPEMTKFISSNPLPDSYEVIPRDPDRVRILSSDIRRAFNTPVCQQGIGNPNAKSGVECVRDGEQVTDRVLTVSRVLFFTFLVGVAVLVVASVLLIANTIRLSIFARRREIEVMKLVGATNWFVRGPFMIEGLICGLVGAVFAIILLVIGKALVVSHIDQVSSTPDVRAMSFELIALILAGVGLVVGALGSGLTMHRYLRV